MQHIIFYLFATVAVCSGISVIAVRNPVRSVLSLVVTFFAMSGVWMLLRAEFLSLILLLVYVGAVMTLFLFVVMMLNIDREVKQRGFVNYLPFGVAVVVLTFIIIAVAVGPKYFGIIALPAPGPEALNYSNIRQLGAILYTEYAYPFEIAGVVLLAAIIAAITLTHRAPLRRRKQSVDKQIAMTPKDAVMIVKMAAEPKQGTS